MSPLHPKIYCGRERLTIFLRWLMDCELLTPYLNVYAFCWSAFQNALLGVDWFVNKSRLSLLIGSSMSGLSDFALSEI
jgi:hypothetical protein